MVTQNIIVLFIFYLVPKIHTTGIHSKYCSRIRQLKNLVEKNKQYKIILVCKGKHIQKLHDIITERYIREIYTIGHGIESKILHKEIKIINTYNDLMFHVLLAAIRYTHDEEIIQRKLENVGVADLLARDIIKLLEQIELRL